ncbi:MAG: NAD-dependent epimerase/dehydratase family protein, partial [Sciscionella sp.]
LDAVVLRVFNPIGPGAPESSLLGRVAAELRRAMTDGTDVRLGPLDAVRDFVDVADVADAVVAAAVAAALPHPVLNIGSGVGKPVRALVAELLAISGWTGAVREDSTGSVRSADVPWQQADITQARQDLRWRPQRELTTSLHGLLRETTL